MNAANTLPFTPDTTRGLLPHTPRGLTKEQGLKSIADYLAAEGFQAEVKGAFVEVQAPYLQLGTEGRPNVIRYEAKPLYTMPGAIRFADSHK